MTGTKDSRGSGDVERAGVEQRGVRASDAEREAVARRIREAAEVGRLGLDEIDERLDLVYSARYRHELAEVTADLPDERARDAASHGPDRRDPRAWRDRVGGRAMLAGPLGVHAAVVATMSVVMISRWAAMGEPRFWPIFPIFWMVVSVVVHARIRARRLGRTSTA